jgi:iron complex outermembrane recepter protein
MACGVEKCPGRHFRWILVAGAIAGAMMFDGGVAFSRQPEDVDYARLREMTLEELMGIQVTSVAGIEQDWFTTPAAMYVITQDELRRSGHRSLAEALRLAPGVFVGTVNAHSWSVGTRGFNGGLANKTLVLIDGRSVYDPLFSGTFWDVQDVLIEDLDRIEVIRGPGATLWGANAVNGVFNIITRSAKDTPGPSIASSARCATGASSRRTPGSVSGASGPTTTILPSPMTSTRTMNGTWGEGERASTSRMAKAAR